MATCPIFVLTQPSREYLILVLTFLHAACASAFPFSLSLYQVVHFFFSLRLIMLFPPWIQCSSHSPVLDCVLSFHQRFNFFSRVRLSRDFAISLEQRSHFSSFSSVPDLAFVGPGVHKNRHLPCIPALKFQLLPTNLEYQNFHDSSQKVSAVSGLPKFQQ